MPGKRKVTVDELPVEIKDDTIYVINQPNPNSVTHNYFKYPCKFIPEIPRWAMKAYLNCENGLVLDPFAGSGTTLLEASLAGHESVGAEIDEIAKLIIKVKSTKLTDLELQEVRNITSQIVQRLEESSYSENEIVLPEINNLTHWFREDILNDLGHTYYSIINVGNDNIKDFLLICMASIVKRVSNSDDISPKPYVSNKIIKNPPPVAKTFEDVVEKHIIGMKELQEYDLAGIRVEGDATHISAEDNSIDIAITSPPYINAFDYVRTLRLENLWLQLSTEDELREKKKLYLGTESIRVKDEKTDLSILQESALLNDYYEQVLPLDEKRALIIKKFFEDMKKNMEEVYRVLKPNSYYLIVIGNSSIRKVDVESWRVLKDLAAGVGFQYEKHIGYEIQNPYIRIPRGNKGGKIAIDHILILKK
ncbi:MAG: DNA methyltransferase [Agathobacter sp.]|nr:DNA methyltransferase [Agathobacter sp.]